ncbi:adenylyltransferase/cytidyltransferase family protein [Candidatus Gracilibacteria bacterium]|nr:adenylyltransferase/cytidyltransferase family protein [Candidatus Gracilibacteria bacterium]NUJ99082.1 adenylyltransferase/cytidyltransferase family protein [Candidatus Gracilibacteria bacterium]
MEKKLGIFIARMNPPHKGHMKIIKKILKENDYALIFIGSSEKNDELNPLNSQERENIIKQNLKNHFENNTIKTILLNDEETDKKWIDTIKKEFDTFSGNLFSETTFYGGDLENDYAIQVIKNFEKELPFEKISYKEISRKNSFISFDGKKYAISGTQIRTLWKEKNITIIEKMLEKNMQKDIISLLRKYEDK